MKVKGSLLFLKPQETRRSQALLWSLCSIRSIVPGDGGQQVGNLGKSGEVWGSGDTFVTVCGYVGRVI